jgi:prepilin-type processing-associated H-X9-DG protein
MANEPSPEPPSLPANPFSEPASAPSGPTETSGLAVASLVLGILSCGLSIIAGIPGLVCGIKALNRIGQSELTAGGPRLAGRGLAIAGIILSCLSLLTTPLLAGMLMSAVNTAREAGRRQMCMINMKEMARGMLTHDDARGILPAAITDAEGRPLLSWRVALLPYVEEMALFRQFHLDEPWDSEHNRALIPRMPKIYVCPTAPLPAGKTRYLLLDGPGAGFETARQRPGDGAAAGVRGVRRADLGKPSRETIMIVEAPSDRAVEWTKPEELTVAPEDLLRLEETQGGHPGGVRHAAFADGSVSRLEAEAGGR